MEKLTYSGSPHIRGNGSTRRIMIDVCIALLPACIVGCVLFGWNALAILAISAVTSVAFEFIYNLTINKMKWKECVYAFDFTSLVTGVLIGMNMPPAVPLYIPAFASLFAIVVVKMLFGGTGKNLFNPAIAGRIFVFLSFTTAMTAASSYVGGSIVLTSGATPFTEYLNGNPVEGVTLLHLFLGNTPGCIGETSALALLVGGIYLAIRKVIDWKLPLIGLVSIGLVSVAFNGFDIEAFLPSILGGGAMLGMIFMATDYVTTPNTNVGRIVYFVLLGALVTVLRYSKATDRIEAVSFAILIMNMTVPLFDRFIVNRPFGYVKPVKAKKEGAK